VAVAVAVAFMVAAGCSAEKVRAAKEERLSAARLDGKFQQDDPLIMMLSPEQRTAMMKQGMLANADEGSDLDGDGIADIVGYMDPAIASRFSNGGTPTTEH